MCERNVRRTWGCIPSATDGLLMNNLPANNVEWAERRQEPHTETAGPPNELAGHQTPSSVVGCFPKRREEMSLQVNTGGDLNHLSTGLYPRGHLKRCRINEILWAKKLNCLFQTSSFLFVNMTNFHDQLNAITDVWGNLAPSWEMTRFRPRKFTEERKHSCILILTLLDLQVNTKTIPNYEVAHKLII